MKLDKKAIEDILALTNMQQGMLFHYLKDPGSEYYFEQLSLEISGEMDRAIFEKAWDFVTRSNEMLRTVFRWENVGNPIQIILKEHKLQPEYYDLSGRDDDKIQKELETIKGKDRQKKFDLREVPFRVALCKLEDNTFQMIISNHHILYDGWSNGIILKEFFNAYKELSEGKEPVTPLKTKFQEFLKWNQARDIDNQETFWVDYLKGFDAKTEFSITKKRKEKETAGTGHFRISIAEAQKEEFEGFAREHKITLASLFYSAWGLLLQKYNNTDDVIFGTTVSGRNAKIPGIEEVVGLFINTPPMRIKTGPDEKTADFLHRVDKELQMREAYETASLVDIKNYSEIDNHEELFDSIVIIENYPLDSRLKLKNTGLSVESYSMVERPHYDLNVIIEIFGGIDCVFIYDKGRYDEEDIERLSRHLGDLPGNIINNPGKKIADIEIVSEQEKNRILYEFNNTDVDYPKDKTIHRLFEEQAVKSPDPVALSGSGHGASGHLNKAVAGGRSEVEHCFLTYRELNERANRLARVLRNRGVGRGDLIGLMPERTVELLTGLLAVLKAGAAYIPLGPEYPEDRCAYILEECRVRILLTGGNRNISRGNIVNISLDSKNDNVEPANLPPAGTPTDLAYVIYTSGTTGKPKGVMIEHRSVINFAKGITDIIPFAPGDSILSLTTLAFDIFGLETLLPLLKGARVVMGREEEQLSPAAIASTIEREKITIFQVTPSRLQLIISDPGASQNLRLLKSLLVGGEAFPEILLENTREFTRGKIYNVYGPTETTIWSTIKDVTGGEPFLNIGKPIANTRIYILNNKGLLQPPGVPGEIYIAGDGLARGYFNNDKLTGEKFLPDPFRPGEKMYKTGDLGKWLPDGNIECMGRMDYQVKIRGFRIELGEIETHLQNYDDVKEAVVTIHEIAENKYLCAYVVAEKALESFLPGLRDYLSEKLPYYMIPAYFVKLDELPLTSNGKIDRKNLPGPEPGNDSAERYRAPRDELDGKLVEIWAEILSINKREIGIDSNFFDLGGHSLKAIALISRIQKELDIKIPMPKIFALPTIRGLTVYIKGTVGHEAGRNKFFGINPAEKKEYYPLSSSQKRLYILNQTEVRSTAYNMPQRMVLEGKLEREKLGKIFKTLIIRHESLRTSFILIGDRPVQKVEPEAEFQVEYHREDGSEHSASRVREIMDNFVKPFDLSHAPLLRVGLIETGADTHILMVNMHHIISDAVSHSILIKDFRNLYNEVELSPLPFQYRDFAQWQNHEAWKEMLEEQEEYWLKSLSGQLPVLNLPTDYKRPKIQNFEGNTVSFELKKEETDPLRHIARDAGVTLYMVLYGAFAVLLSKLGGQEEIIIGVPTTGRTHVELEGIVGLFVNILAVRNFPAGDKTFRAFLREIKTQMPEAFGNQEYPFDTLVTKLLKKRDPARNPIFDVVFNMPETTDFNSGSDTLVIKDMPDGHGFGIDSAQFDINLLALDMGEKIRFKLEYCTKLFRLSTIERFIDYFRTILSSLSPTIDVKLSAIEMITREEQEELLMITPVTRN